MTEQQLDMMGADLDQILEHLDQLTDEQVKTKIWPQTLVNLVEVITAALMRDGMSKDSASNLAHKVVVSQAHYMGGRDFYLPKDERLQTALRNIKIWNDFSGRNTHTLIKKYGLTRQQLATILAEQRALHTAKVQIPLL